MTCHDLVQQHVRCLLEAPFRAEADRLRQAEEITRTGLRVVEGVLSSATGWELRDWLTGAVIRRGDDGPAGLTRALSGHYDADDLFTDVPEPATPGIPPSLGRAIEEWLFAASTPDQDIAEFIGWPVGEVREHR
ncbi:hypothetical protein [Actinoplanes couchii]|uniref:DUF4240 domain-containing protein n=1 Tax=Actinoplanes couchii TaxID=403638 RepID=A0ABQ3XMT8_9ACTN|nr:hypothetical protein [Actinoplanes couchii]MDR6317828.1 hypothetical protein [Actinoplanes couchii]GID59816.1 hypothetical protein Aco03nite_082200 [Actinoplanes couchii]